MEGGHRVEGVGGREAEPGVVGAGEEGAVGGREAQEGEVGVSGGFDLGLGETGDVGSLRACVGAVSWAGRVRTAPSSLGGLESTRPMRRSRKWVRGTGDAGMGAGVSGGAWSTRSLTGPPGAMSVTRV